jgi:hypothetical protein
MEDFAVLLKMCRMQENIDSSGVKYKYFHILTFRHRASCILGQAFRYSPENAFYVFNQQIYLII